MILQFEQFKGTIENPTITITKVNDDIINKVCSVEILMQVDNATFHSLLEGFTYVDTWEDVDIENWVSVKILEYQI